MITSPRGRWPTRRIEPKSTFIIMGIIISQTRMAIGPLIWLPEPNSMRRSEAIAPGSNLPRTMPSAKQSPTHSVRKRSKTFNCFVCGGGMVADWPLFMFQL